MILNQLVLVYSTLHIMMYLGNLCMFICTAYFRQALVLTGCQHLSIERFAISYLKELLDAK